MTTETTELSVVEVRDAAGLAEHVPAWEALVAAAVEPNVFYEPWMLMPAIEAFGGGCDLRFVLVYAPDPINPKGPPLLCGLFPLERRSRYRRLPVVVLGLWRHPHCFLCTPLLRDGFARDAFDKFLIWAAGEAALVELPKVPGEGPFQQLLVERQALGFVSENYTRAFFRRRETGEVYLQVSVKGHHRRKMKRLERQLAETGPNEYRALTADGDLEAWVSAFLALEAAGWKGHEGTALTANPADERFFRAVVTGAFQRGRLLMHALHHAGRPIAMNCYLRSGPGGYFFKPTFDETFARFSPGRLLEVETIHRLHGVVGVEWVDSCTRPDNELLNALWADRRTIQSLVVSTGRAPGDFVVSVLPLLRWLSRKVRWSVAAPFTGAREDASVKPAATVPEERSDKSSTPAPPQSS